MIVTDKFLEVVRKHLLSWKECLVPIVKSFTVSHVEILDIRFKSGSIISLAILLNTNVKSR